MRSSRIIQLPVSAAGISIAMREEEIRPEKTAAARSYIDRKKTYFFLKRVFDIIFSLIVIIFILSWLIPVIAFLIRIDSKGPVFFSQKRVGRGGISFSCFKFRTMFVNADADKKQAHENDRRITRFGRFLRKSNLDEFPQFFNVLMGSMSIVGPRPHMYADCSRFSSVIKGYKFRNLVKPGITGLAQVKGYHGPVTDRTGIFRRYQWDAIYVRNAGFKFDLQIAYETAMQRIDFLFSSLLNKLRGHATRL